MAATKKPKVGSSKSIKKTVKKARLTAAPKPAPKRAPARKKAPPVPAKAIKKPISKNQNAAKNAKQEKKASSKTTPVRKAASAVLSPNTTDRVKKLVKKTAAPPSKTAAKTVTKAAVSAESKRPRFNKSDLNQFRLDLLSTRERITGQSGAMRHAALQRNDEINPEEDGTDAFMRLQTLEQVSTQQQLITNIDEALRSIEKGSYGVCSLCGELISKPRLTVLPFAKNCIKCQSEIERQPRPGGRR